MIGNWYNGVHQREPTGIPQTRINHGNNKQMIFMDTQYHKIFAEKLLLMIQNTQVPKGL